MLNLPRWNKSRPTLLFIQLRHDELFWNAKVLSTVGEQRKDTELCSCVQAENKKATLTCRRAFRTLAASRVSFSDLGSVSGQQQGGKFWRPRHTSPRLCMKRLSVVSWGTRQLHRNVIMVSYQHVSIFVLLQSFPQCPWDDGSNETASKFCVLDVMVGGTISAQDYTDFWSGHSSRSGIEWPVTTIEVRGAIWPVITCVEGKDSHFHFCESGSCCQRQETVWT